MTRGLVVLGLALVLAGLVVGEQLYVNHVFSKMKNETAAIVSSVHAYPDDTESFSDELKTRIDKLRLYWIGRERSLAVFIRHIDLTYISDAVTYSKNFIDFGNKEEAANGLSRLSYLLDTYHGVYGLNGFNIL